MCICKCSWAEHLKPWLPCCNFLVFHYRFLMCFWSSRHLASHRTLTIQLCPFCSSALLQCLCLAIHFCWHAWLCLILDMSVVQLRCPIWNFSVSKEAYWFAGMINTCSMDETASRSCRMSLSFLSKLFQYLGIMSRKKTHATDGFRARDTYDLKRELRLTLLSGVLKQISIHCCLSEAKSLSLLHVVEHCICIWPSVGPSPLLSQM